MDSGWTARTEHDLMTELDDIERAIARSTPFFRWTDRGGGTHVQVSDALVELVEREEQIVAELRRRQHPVQSAA